MSNRRVKNLFKNKQWTGRELGQLLIASLINDIRQVGEEDKKALFDNDELVTAEKGLSSIYQKTIYAVFKELYNGLIDSYNYNQAIEQQFYNGYNKLLVNLREAENAENIIAAYYEAPIILTNRQYKKLEEEARAEKRSYSESYASLIFYSLDYFIQHIDKAPKEIKKALEEAKKQEVTKEAFIQEYIKEYNLGYYILPNGIRSDKASPEQWQEALEAEYLKKHELIIDGKKAGYDETIKSFNNEAYVNANRLYYLGAETTREELEKLANKEIEASDEDILRALEFITLSGGYKSELEKLIRKLAGYDDIAEWRLYQTPPEPLNLLDYIEYCINIGDDTKEQREAIGLLKKEAPKVLEAVKSFIELNIEKARGLKANQYYKDIIKWEELGAIEYLNYRELLEVDSLDVIDVIRDSKEYEGTPLKEAASYYKPFKAIATLKEFKDDKEEENYYTGKENILNYAIGLDKLTDEDIIITQATIDTLISPAIKHIYAYNALIDILRQVYSLKDLEELKYETSGIEGKIRAYNNILYIFYRDIKGSDEQKSRKRQKIKQAFKPIILEELKPTSRAIEAVSSEIQSLEYDVSTMKKLKYLDDFIVKLSNGDVEDEN